MKLAFFEVNKPYRELFIKAFPNDELFFFDCELLQSVPQQVRDVEVLSVFVCSLITADVLKQFTNLKLIAARSTGYDNIDVYAANQMDILVCNVPHYAGETVAEYVFALLLSLSRKIYKAYYRVNQEHSFSHINLQGFDLHGKTLGVIGTGNIGRHVIKIANGFGMNCIATDSTPDESLEQELGFSYTSFDTLLKTADIITLHVPLTAQTRHMINKKNIHMLKKGAYIINTARGGIIETDALIEALDKGIVAGAGLDVLEEECFTRDPLALLVDSHPQKKELKAVLENHYLINHPQVIVTPHNAFNSHEALERLLHITIENIKAWQAGDPINIVV